MRQPAFSEFDASLKWISGNGRYTVTAWGDNLTNAAVLTSLVTQPFGSHLAFYNPPRTFGMKFGYRF